MGYYAYSDFELTFPSEQAALDALTECTPEAKNLQGDALQQFWWIFNAEGDAMVTRNDDGTVTVSGSGSDKAFGPFDDGDATCELLLKHGCVGVLDWRDDNDPDDRTRIRFARGQATLHAAVVIEQWPTDPEATPDPITAMYEVATDYEAGVLDQLRLRANLIWECKSCGTHNAWDRLHCDDKNEENCVGPGPNAAGHVWVRWHITDNHGKQVGGKYATRHSTNPILFKDSDEALNDDTFEDHRWHETWLGKVTIDDISWVPLNRQPAEPTTVPIDEGSSS